MLPRPERVERGHLAGLQGEVENAQVLTGQSRCVVAHYDHIGDIRYTRTAFLYPVVEQNPEYGLLVGVSTGGPVRIPLDYVIPDKRAMAWASQVRFDAALERLR